MKFIQNQNLKNIGTKPYLWRKSMDNDPFIFSLKRKFQEEKTFLKNQSIKNSVNLLLFIYFIENENSIYRKITPTLIILIGRRFVWYEV